MQARASNSLAFGFAIVSVVSTRPASAEISIRAASSAAAVEAAVMVLAVTAWPAIVPRLALSGSGRVLPYTLPLDTLRRASDCLDFFEPIAAFLLCLPRIGERVLPKQYAVRTIDAAVILPADKSIKSHAEAYCFRRMSASKTVRAPTVSSSRCRVPVARCLPSPDIVRAGSPLQHTFRSSASFAGICEYLSMDEKFREPDGKTHTRRWYRCRCRKAPY